MQAVWFEYEVADKQVSDLYVLVTHWVTTNGRQFADDIYKSTKIYGSGHETVVVLLPGFAINW